MISVVEASQRLKQSDIFLCLVTSELLAFSLPYRGNFAERRRGDTYTATVYNPRPTTAQRQRAGADYPPDLRHFRTITVPVQRLGLAGVTRVSVDFPPFGDPSPPQTVPPQTGGANASAVLAQSSLSAVWDLAKKLKRGTNTPEAFVQRVLDYLDKGNENRHACSLYLSIMDCMGVKLDRFGDTGDRLQGLWS